LASALILTSASAMADWYVQPKLGYESRNYELNVSDISATATIPGVIAGLSLINSTGWYLDFETSVGDSEVDGFFAEEDYIKRYDITFSGGKSLGSGFTVFGGYNIVETEMANQKQQIGEADEVLFSTEGAFGGLSKSFTISKTQTLSLSGAIGMMTGYYRITEFNVGEDEAEGTAIGYSANLAYSYRPGNSLALTLGLKTQTYNYTDMTDENDGSSWADTDETLSNLFAKASYTF